MAILITYPKMKVPVYWRMKLEQKDDVIYFPFRILKAVKLSASEKQRLRQSKNFAITSIYGAQTFVDHLHKLNTTATIYVLSTKIKKMLTRVVTNPVVVAPGENRDALLNELIDKKVTDICWLVGDQAQKYYRDFVGKTLVIYINTWDRDHEVKALKLFMQQSITSILVTSPSNFDRMFEVMTMVDSNDFRNINYYVLGQSTGDYLKKKGLKVIYPNSKENVLESVLDNLWKYERVH